MVACSGLAYFAPLELNAVDLFVYLQLVLAPDEPVSHQSQTYFSSMSISCRTHNFRNSS